MFSGDALTTASLVVLVLWLVGALVIVLVLVSIVETARNTRKTADDVRAIRALLEQQAGAQVVEGWDPPSLTES